MASVITTDLFDRTDSAGGGVGNSWLDAGSIYKILSVAVVLAAQNDSGADNTTSVQLLRPAGENQLTGLASFVFKFSSAAGSQPKLIFRAAAGNTYYYIWIREFGRIDVNKLVAGTVTNLGNQSAAMTNGAYYRLSVSWTSVSGGTATTIEARLAAEATPNTVIASKTVTGNTEATLQSAGKQGFIIDGLANDIDVKEYELYDFTDGVWPTFTTPNPAPGSIAFGSVTPTAVTISNTTAPSGGTGSLTVSWHSSTTSGFTPGAGNVISGQTGNSLTNYAAASEILFYKRRVTDSLGVTGDSNQIAGPLQDSTVTSFVPGFIGDSIYANVPHDGSSTLTPPDAIALWLGRTLNQDRVIRYSNQAIGGWQTADWLPTAPYLGPAITAFQAISVTHVMIMLGTNDASALHGVSANTYSSNMAAICNAIIAAGMKVILNYPPYVKPGALQGAFNETTLDLLIQYQAKIDLLVNGTTILQGDKLAFREFAKHAEPTPEDWYIAPVSDVAAPNGDDWVHPNGRGVYALAELQAQKAMSILNPSTVIVLDD
jgi:lysophospholipase L1-like esterase